MAEPSDKKPLRFVHASGDVDAIPDNGRRFAVVVPERKGPAAERPGFFRGARVNSKRPATDKG